MSMRASLTRLRDDRRGGSAVEFAFIAPLLLLLALGVVEIGRLVSQADAVEKNLRAAAVFAARSELPLDADTITTIENLVRTGTPDGSGAAVVPGWSEEDASIVIEPRTVDVDGEEIEVIRLTANVPFVPILAGLLDTFGFDDFTIKTSHDQAYIGI